MRLAAEESMPEDRSCGAVAPISLEELYASQGRFVWSTLSRLGVAGKDLEDQVQEVFVVVHRRIAEFRPDASVRTWLFAICQRVASNYRRGANTVLNSHIDGDEAETTVESDTGPEHAAMDKEARALLKGILDQMGVEQRAVFVMFEVELMSASEIADIVGVPVPTIYSRLAAARKIFERGAQRVRLKLERKENSR